MCVCVCVCECNNKTITVLLCMQKDGGGAEMKLATHVAKGQMPPPTHAPKEIYPMKLSHIVIVLNIHIHTYSIYVQYIHTVYMYSIYVHMYSTYVQYICTVYAHPQSLTT